MNWTRLAFSFFLAAAIWTGYGLISYVIQLHEDRAAMAEELERYRVAAVTERSRAGWYCKPFQRHAGAWLCIAPDGRSS